MAVVSIRGDALLVELRGWERIWALKRHIVVPLADVERVERTPIAEVMRPEGLRLPGSYLPRVVAAGSYWWRGRWTFWSVRYRDRDRAVTIVTRRGRYRKIVVTVGDPDATVEAVRAAI